MELLAGAHTNNKKRRIKGLIGLFKKLGRILIPTVRDYEQAGEILIRLQNIKGYDIRKSAMSIPAIIGFLMKKEEYKLR